MQPLTRKARIMIERKLRDLNAGLSDKIRILEATVKTQDIEINNLKDVVAGFDAEGSQKSGPTVMKSEKKVPKKDTKFKVVKPKNIKGDIKNGK